MPLTVCSGVSVLSQINNTELNDLRKIICLRKTNLCLKEKQFLMFLKKLVEHGIHFLLFSYINDIIRYIIIATMTSH